MSSVQDGPASSLAVPLTLKGNIPLSMLADVGVSEEMRLALEHAPRGSCVSWGIPFEIGDVVVTGRQGASVDLELATARWLLFMHTSDLRDVTRGPGGIFSPMRGEGQLAEHAADYVMVYDDGTQERVAVRRRHEIGTFQRRWGENCFQAVAHQKPNPRRPPHEQPSPGWGWGQWGGATRRRAGRAVG